MGYWLEEYSEIQGQIRKQGHNGKPLSEHPNYDNEQSAEDFSGCNIIFLDVDGVLNDSCTCDRIKQYVGIDDSKVAILKEMVQLMNAKIVLSSSWKEGWYPYAKDKQDAFATILDHRLAEQGLTIVDKTVDPYGQLRGCGIIDWIRKQKDGVGKILILDDETFDFKACGLRKYQIQTSWGGPNGGLSEKHLRQLERMLPNLTYTGQRDERSKTRDGGLER